MRAELEDYLADQRVGLPRATPAELSEAVHSRLRVDASGLADALGEALRPADEAERAARVARRRASRRSQDDPSPDRHATTMRGLVSSARSVCAQLDPRGIVYLEE